MTKLIVQIPCLNEEHTLPLVINDIPKNIQGIDVIEILVIDDGSTDNTINVARQLGVHHIIKNIGRKGLGNAFRIGLEHALRLNADILVNTDGDNQYPSKYISQLILPILHNEADIVVGNRQTDKIAHFSFTKKKLQQLGTIVTNVVAKESQIKDSVSGFRAYSKQAIIELNITSDFSYVLDTTIQAAKKRIKMANIDITTNPPTRPSRLFKNIGEHIRKSSIDILRVYAMYKPLKTFIFLGGFILFLGGIPIIRFLVDYYYGSGGQGKIQSLLLGAIFIIIGFNFFALGIIGDLLSKNRRLIEYILNTIKTKQINDRDDP